MRKAWKGLLLAVVLGVALSVGLSAASAKPKATVTISVLEVTTGQTASELINTNFERVYPNIQLKVTFLPSNQVSQLVTTELQAGNAPDVFYVAPGSGAQGLWNLAHNGKLLAMTGQPWVKRIYGAVKKYVTYKGTPYGWPVSVTPHDPIANPTLLAKLHLSIPTTANQILADCKTIKAAGLIPFAQSFNTVAGGIIAGRQLYSNYVYNHDPNWDAERYAKKVTFASSPLWKNALQFFVDMKNAGCFSPGIVGTSRIEQYTQFATGQAVFSMITGGEIANIQAINPNVPLEMFNMPAGNNPKDDYVQAFAGIVLAGNKATKNPTAVKDFISFYARAEQSTLWAKVGGGIAPFDATRGIVPPVMKALTPEFKAGHLDSSHEEEWPNGDVFQSIANGMTGLLTGQTTIPQVLATADKYWNEGESG